jgi:hypothetical protein
MNLLKDQFSDLKVEDIDSYLLEMFKSRLFFNYKTEIVNHSPNRYNDSQENEMRNQEKIISFLRKENPNSVTIEASSIGDSTRYPIKNLFVDDNSTFSTQYIPNSSICFSFHHHKILISKYFIRSVNSDWNLNSLKNWKIEGSNDKFN